MSSLYYEFFLTQSLSMVQLKKLLPFSSMEFCQNYWESGTPRPHSTATLRYPQIFMGIKNLMIHVKTVALAVTNGVIVEGRRKDK